MRTNAGCRIRTIHLGGFLALAVATAAGQPPSSPAELVATLARSGNLAEAGRVVDRWLSAFPDDNDAKAWNARLAAWQGRYADAEREFVALRKQAPHDLDVVLGLASVWNAQKRYNEALSLFEEACPDAAARPECGTEKAKTLVAAGRVTEARHLCRALSEGKSAPADCRNLLAPLQENGRGRVVITAGTDRMNFTADSVSVSQAAGYRWNERWDTELKLTQFMRFGQTVQGLDFALTFQPDKRTAITAAVGTAGKQDLAPRARVRFAVDRGFTVSRRGPVRAIEATYDQGSISYSSGRLLTFSPGMLVYLPKEWDCLFQLTSIRLHSPQDTVNWTLSGLARVSFPIVRRLRASILAGGGSENLGTVERLLFRSSSAAGAVITVKAGAGRQVRLGARYQRIEGGRSVVGYESAFAFRF